MVESLNKNQMHVKLCYTMMPMLHGALMPLALQWTRVDLKVVVGFECLYSMSFFVMYSSSATQLQIILAQLGAP
jgi:hypothetical protein